MSARPTVRLECDGQWAGQEIVPCRHFRVADTTRVREARAEAKAAGWAYRRWNGEWVDLCPRHAEKCRP